MYYCHNINIISTVVVILIKDIEKYQIENI